MTEKGCTKCGKVKPIEEFGRNRTRKDGRAVWCKECKKAHYEANREEVLAQQKAYKEANREKIAARNAAWYAANREKARTQRNAYYEANREELRVKKKAYYEANREKNRAKRQSYRDANREMIRARDLMRNYGLTLEQYGSMLEAQRGVCAFCGKTPEENGKRLAVDHDHDTDEVRWLLCGNCNFGVGYFQDNPALMRKAADMLEKWQNL